MLVKQRLGGRHVPHVKITAVTSRCQLFAVGTERDSVNVVGMAVELVSSLPSATFQIRIVLSTEPDASLVPSGLNESE